MNARIQNRESVVSDSPSWQQIEVPGEHATLLDDERVTQVIDAEATQAIATEFAARRSDPEWSGMLVDFDHLSHNLSHSTEAMAWLMDVQIRNGELWGLLDWTDTGAAAVRGRRWKYFSTEYDDPDLEDLGPGPDGRRRLRPLRLGGLALTNRPQIRGGRPITNRKGEPSPEQNPTQHAKTKSMKSIAEKLGLPAEATEEQIVAEVGKIMNRAAQADTLEAEAEAEVILNRHAKRIPEGGRDKWRARLIANRAAAEEILAELPERDEQGIDPATLQTRPRVFNRASAGTPDGASLRQAEGDDARATAAEEAKAARISNRARTLHGQGSTMTAAYQEAARQIEAEDVAQG